MKAMARAQIEDGKRPEDMQRLLTANATVVITNYQPPEAGKKNGGKVRSTLEGSPPSYPKLPDGLAPTPVRCASQFDCKLCSVTNVLGESMGGLLRHVCMPKHRNKWLQHTDAPPSAEELHSSLSRKCWVPDKSKMDDSHVTYVAKRAATKLSSVNKARKLMKGQVSAAVAGFLSAGVTGSAGDSSSTSPAPAFTLPPITPENAADVGAMLAGRQM